MPKLLKLGHAPAKTILLKIRLLRSRLRNYAIQAHFHVDYCLKV